MTGKQHLKSVSALSTLVLVLITVASAQSFRGSIRGKVTDPSGSIIAGAKVSAKNTGTALTREVTTGDDGAYVLAELPAGVYTVTAQAAGLSPAAMNVQVNVGLDTTADFDLTKVEKRQEQLDVTSQAPVVDAERDVLGEVIDRKLVTELPLNGRDFGKLVALVPGATVEPSGVAAIQSGFGQFSINGNRDRSNNYTLDGTDNNDPFFNNSALNQTGIGGAPGSLLPIDAIQEFNLQSQFPAEYGRNSGSVINIITKSGTNQLHGSVFEFLRNDLFDARNFFNRTPAPKSPFRNNNFGASLGGPIVHNKMFFFGAYEGQRERVGSDFTLFVPTQEQITQAQADAIANGVTPSPALTTFLGFFPQATGSNGITGTVPSSIRDKNDVNSLIAKIDQALTNNEQFSARYAFAQSTQTFPLGGLGTLAASRLAQFAQTSPARVQVVSANLLSALSPTMTTMLNEVRFGYSRYRTSFNSLNASYDPSQAGIDFGTGKLGLPEIDFGGIFENLGATAFSIPRGRTSQTFQILDNFTWVRGHHTLKFGGEYRRALIDSFNDNLERGGIVFGPGNGLDPDPGTDILAAYYLGFDSFTLANAGDTHRSTSNNGFAFFAQDDFRATPNLTINLGLRWEYFGPLNETHNILANLGSDGNLAIVGTDGVDGAYQKDHNNFGPRLGFAWSPLHSTVIRAAYGVYFDYIPQHLLTTNFTNDAGLTTPPIGPRPVQPLNFDSDAFSGVSGAPVFTPVTQPFAFDIFLTPRNLVTPYAQSWNLNVEHELVKNVAFQVGYVGSKGTKLVRLRDANQAFVDGSRPNPNYGFMDEFATISSSTYHALQTTFRIQNWHGLAGFAGYTWSKSLDDASDGIDFNFATVAIPQDSNNLRAEHGPSNFDTRHRFTAAFTYQIPHLVGPELFSRGWQLNTIITAQSGRPVPIVSGLDTSGNGFPTPSNSHQRPNLVPGANPIVSNWESAPDSIGYLNPAAFTQPLNPVDDIPSFGNLGRNAIYGPHFWNVDFAVAKNFPVFDRLSLQLRAEFFNIFNHPNFALPNFFVTPTTFADGSPTGAPTNQGLISQTPDQAQTNPGLGGGGPRVIQLGLKLVF